MAGLRTRTPRPQGLLRVPSVEEDSKVEEGSKADRFWIVLTGLVALDVHVPGRRAATVDAMGQGELLGWSWLVPPHTWQLGAEAHGPVHALGFDAAAVRTLCEGIRCWGWRFPAVSPPWSGTGFSQHGPPAGSVRAGRQWAEALTGNSM